MGRLNVEIEQETIDYYKSRNGILVNICEGNDEVLKEVKMIESYCDKCGKCMAYTGAISLGEIRWNLRGSGLFAIGPLNMSSDRNSCPIINEELKTTKT